MKNVYHKKGWILGINPSYVWPLTIALIKETCIGQSDKYLVKIKFRRYPTSSTSDLYEFIMSFFYHGKPEEFLLFICNFNMTLLATGTLDMDAKMPYSRTIFYRQLLRQFDLLSDDVKNIETLNVDYYIKGLVFYFPS